MLSESTIAVLGSPLTASDRSKPRINPTTTKTRTITVVNPANVKNVRNGRRNRFRMAYSQGSKRNNIARPKTVGRKGRGTSRSRKRNTKHNCQNQHLAVQSCGSPVDAQHKNDMWSARSCRPVLWSISKERSQRFEIVGCSKTSWSIGVRKIRSKTGKEGFSTTAPPQIP